MDNVLRGVAVGLGGLSAAVAIAGYIPLATYLVLASILLVLMT